MQTLPTELRACVLDYIEGEASDGTVDGEIGLAKRRAEVLLAVALLGRSWTADAQARLGRVVIIHDPGDLLWLSTIAAQHRWSTIINACRGEYWSSEERRILNQIIIDVSPRSWIGAWPLDDRTCEPDRGIGLNRIARLHLSSSDAALTPDAAVESLFVDQWVDDPRSHLWPSGTAIALRHLSLDATAYPGADELDDLNLGGLLGACHSLSSLRVWGVALTELALALPPAGLTSLRHLTLGLIEDFAHQVGDTALSARVADLFAPQVTCLDLGDSTLDTTAAPDHRDQYLIFARAWLEAVPRASAREVSIKLRPRARRLRNEEDVDDGAFSTLVARFEEIGARCSLETVAFAFGRPMDSDQLQSVDRWPSALSVSVARTLAGGGDG